MSLKERILLKAMSPLLKEAKVTQVTRISEHFRRVSLVSERFREKAIRAGDKIQLAMPGLQFRTYTPIDVDTKLAKLSIIVYSHGNGPGSEWGEAVKPGDAIWVFGPRSSIPLDELAGPVVLVGDETSLGLAKALRSLPGREGSRCAFEVTVRAEAEEVLSHLEHSGAELFERQGEGHWPKLLAWLREQAAQQPQAQLVMTGRAQTIQYLQKGLKREGVRFSSGKTKAYWAPGKKGID